MPGNNRNTKGKPKKVGDDGEDGEEDSSPRTTIMSTEENPLEAKAKAVPDEQDAKSFCGKRTLIYVFTGLICVLFLGGLVWLLWSQEQRISYLEHSIECIQREKAKEEHRIQLLEGSLQRNCDVFYVGKCFRYIEANEDVNFGDGEAMCRRTGWELANIYDGLHYDMIAEYMRGKIPKGSIRITTWLGMTINTKNNQVNLSNGRKASVDELKWYPGYPLSGDDHTKMGLVIMTDNEKEPQGIHSWSHESDRSGALCEI